MSETTPDITSLPKTSKVSKKKLIVVTVAALTAAAVAAIANSKLNSESTDIVDEPPFDTEA